MRDTNALVALLLIACAIRTIAGRPTPPTVNQPLMPTPPQLPGGGLPRPPQLPGGGLPRPPHIDGPILPTPPPIGPPIATPGTPGLPGPPEPGLPAPTQAQPSTPAPTPPMPPTPPAPGIVDVDNPPVIELPDWLVSQEDTDQRPPDVIIDDVLPPAPTLAPGQLPPDTDIEDLLPPINSGDEPPPVVESPPFWPDNPSEPDELPETIVDWGTVVEAAPFLGQLPVDGQNRPSWWPV